MVVSFYWFLVPSLACSLFCAGAVVCRSAPGVCVASLCSSIACSGSFRLFRRLCPVVSSPVSVAGP